MLSLSNVSIKNKLWILLAMALLGSLLLQVSSALQSHQNLLDGRKQQIEFLVENTLSLLADYHNKRDALGDESARRQALEAVRALRYDNGKGYFWVNDKQLNLLLHPFKPEKEGQNMAAAKDADGQLHWQAMANVVKSKGQGFVRYSYQGPQFDSPAAKISYVAEFKPWGMIVGTGVYIEDIESSFYSMLARSLMVYLVIFGALTAFAYYVSRSITQPLKSMMQTMKTVASGDLTVSLNGEQRNDELGVLNRSFAHVLTTFRDLVTHVQNANDSIRRSIDMSAVVSSETSEGMNQQGVETEHLVEAVHGLSAALQQVSTQASETRELSNQVRGSIEESNSMMNRTVGSVQEVSASVTTASDVICKLEQDIKQIDGILDVIRNISEQTNLLALNAAIEAARAGESGRGFAVVADEVRTLAQRTQESTAEIQAMTEGLQSEALKAVSVMEQSVEAASVGAEAATSTGTVLQQATDRVVDVAGSISEITQVVNQEDAVVKGVLDKVEVIRGIAEKAAAGSKALNTNREELVELIESSTSILKQYRL